MADSVTHDNAPESLPEFLTRRARGASDRRLAIDVAVGVLVSAAAVIWRPSGWIAFLAAAICLAAFGAWGITDRELEERRASGDSRTSLLRAARAAVAAVGGVGALVLLVSVLGLALGTWIS
jgi:hypothetical protein